MSQETPTSSVSIPSIYLRAKSHPTAPSKRTIFPSSMEQLLKQANALFRNLKCVRSIFTSDGCLLEDVSEIKPGDVLYVSSQEPDFQSIRRTPTPKRQSQTPRQDQKGGAQTNDSELFKRRFGGNVQSIQTQEKEGDSPKKIFHSSRLPAPRSHISSSKVDSTPEQSPNDKKPSTPVFKTAAESTPGQFPQSKRNTAPTPEDGESTPQQSPQRRKSTTPTFRGELQEDSTPEQSQQRRKSTTPIFKGENQDEASQDSKHRPSPQRKSFGAFGQSLSEDRDTAQNSEEVSDKTAPGIDEQTPQTVTSKRFVKRDRTTEDSEPVPILMTDKRDGRQTKTGGIIIEEEPEQEGRRQNEQNLMTPRKGAIEFDYDDMQNLFDSYFSDVGMDSHIAQAAQQQPYWAREILSKAPRVEDQQQSYWYNNVLGFIEERGFKSEENLFAGETLWKKASEIVNRQNKQDFRLRVAVTGPRQSGKSTFLSLIAKAALAQLVRSGMYKRTFVVAFDCLEICSEFDNPNNLFEFIVGITIQALARQQPALDKFSSDLVRLFRTGMSPARLISEYPAFGQEAVKIAKTIIGFKNDPTCIYQFYTQLFLLPEMLSKAAGFREVLFVVDDFDVADVTAGTDGFEEKDQIFIVEFLKLALKRSSFIISHQDLDRFYGSLQPTEEDGVELLSVATMISTLGLIEYESEPDLVVRFEGNQLPFHLSKDDCGGAAAFLKRWEELNAELDSVDPDDLQSEETVLFVTHVQQFVEELYEVAQEDDDGILVVSVKRLEQ